MIKPSFLLSLGVFALSACQMGPTPEEKLANAACADASLQSGCHQMIHGALEAQAEQRQADAQTVPGARRQQHSYLDDFETRPAIIDSPIAPPQTETQTQTQTEPPSTPEK